VKANQLVSITLVAGLWLGCVGATGAQTGWPDSRKTRATKTATPAKAARTASKASGKPARAKTARPASRPRIADEAALRAMSAIIARQTQAIEALTRRLEAAERRLDMASAPAIDVLVEDTVDPFRAARSVDWAEIVDALR